MKHKDSEKSKEEKPAGEQQNQQENAPHAAEKELQELAAKAETLQKEKDELFAKLQRLSADYLNFQKRVPKQIEEAVIYEKEKMVKMLLPSLDNFERTLNNIEKVDNIKSLSAGIKIVYDQMLEILKTHGAEQISEIGEKFDPSLHEAVVQQNEETKEDNIVLEEFQKGYRMSGRTIRPSKVAVNKLLPKTPAQEESSEEPETTDTE